MQEAPMRQAGPAPDSGMSHQGHGGRVIDGDAGGGITGGEHDQLDENAE